jgi:hypothetical protein
MALETKMKKRKSPVLLMSMLVVLVAGVVMFGMAQMKPDANAPAPPEAPDSMKEESRAAPAAAAVGDALRSKLPPPAPTKREGGPKLPPSAPDSNEPTISTKPLNERMPKPKFDGTNTVGGQWYSPESAASKH